MRKSLIYFAVGALTLTACTSQEEVDNVKTSKGNVIKFENVVNKHSRADLTSSTLEQFNVFGFYTMPGIDDHAHQVFYNTPVTKKIKDGVESWDYSENYGERYWIPGAKYYFYAYSCNNTEIKKETVEGIDYSMNMTDGLDAGDRVLEIQNYVCNNNHQHDLIFASNNSGIPGLEQGNPDVSLEFKHILSKVKAKFTTKFPTEYQIEIKDLAIVGIRDKGNYDSTNKWHSLSKSADDQALALLDENESMMVESPIEGNSERKTVVETAQFYVIPNGSDDPVKGDDSETVDVTYALKFTIDVYIGTNRKETVMSKTLTGAFNPTWQPGYQYVYNVDINGNTTHMEVIAFTTEVDDFGNPEVSPDITEFEVVNNEVNKKND